MTLLQVASIGSYPRTGDEKDHQRYPRALGHFERKEISAHALRDVEQSIVQEVIREQVDRGADEVTDGLVTWSDPISRFCRNLSGVKSGGLARYFDNNFYCRVPILPAKPKLSTPVLADYNYAKGCSNRPVRAVLTGPLTLARHTRSESKLYDKLAARVALFTDVIACEVAALAKENAPVIQIDEPALTNASSEERKLAAAAFAKLVAAKGASKIALAVFYGPVFPIVDYLIGLPADILQLDLSVDGSAVIQRLSVAPPRNVLGLGAANGRSTVLESVEELLFLVRPFVDKAPAKIYLTPSCGLELVPRSTAMAKLGRLAELRTSLSQPGAPLA